jgi:Bacteriodetes cell division protein (FtsL-like)
LKIDNLQFEMSEDKEIKNSKRSAQKNELRRFLSYQWVVKNIPFFFFLAMLTVLYIYNGHYSDRITRKIEESEKHIQELEYEYKTAKSEVIFRSKASELAKAVAPLGLKELTTAPMTLTDSTATGN